MITNYASESRKGSRLVDCRLPVVYCGLYLRHLFEDCELVADHDQAGYLAVADAEIA